MTRASTRALAVLGLVFLSTACVTQAREIYRAYSGDALPTHSVVTIRIPAVLGAIELNGGVIDAAKYSAIQLEPGKHVIKPRDGVRLAFIIRPIAIDAMRPRLRNELLIGSVYRIDETDPKTSNGGAFALVNDLTGEIAVVGVNSD